MLRLPAEDVSMLSSVVWIDLWEIIDDSLTQQQCLEALQKSGKECSIA
uniref:Uncharacterized protein n=1 Tax=Tetranychus urticae TaxID=32264 RepID=T1KJR3_TETUR